MTTPRPEITAPSVGACDDERIHTFGVMLEAVSSLNRVFDRSLRESTGLNQSVFEGLLRLERSGGELSMGALTEQIALTSGGATRMVNRLVEQGFATRRTCTDDRRVQYVAITEAGRRALSSAIRVHLADLEEHFIAHMSEDERSTLVAVMERIRSAG